MSNLKIFFIVLIGIITINLVSGANINTNIRVQRGTFSMATEFAVNITIASINPNQSFAMVSVKSSDATPGGGVFIVPKLINATTLQLRRDDNNSNPTDLNWQVISSTDLDVKAINLTAVHGTTEITTTITPVNTSNTFLIVSSTTNGTTASEMPNVAWNARFINSTTIHLNRVGIFNIERINVQVITWNNSAVYNGTIPFLNESQLTSTLPTTINSSSSLLFFSYNSTASLNTIAQFLGYMNNTSVTLARATGGANNMTASWFVVSHPSIVSQSSTQLVGAITTPINITFAYNPPNISRVFSINTWTQDQASSVIIRGSTTHNVTFFICSETGLTCGNPDENITVLQLEKEVASGNTNNSFFLAEIKQNYTVPDSNTCSYPGSGVWNIKLSDFCYIQTSINVLGNLVNISDTSGVGNLTIVSGGKIFNFTSLNIFVNRTNTNKITIQNGGILGGFT